MSQFVQNITSNTKLVNEISHLMGSFGLGVIGNTSSCVDLIHLSLFYLEVR